MATLCHLSRDGRAEADGAAGDIAVDDDVIDGGPVEGGVGGVKPGGVGKVIAHNKRITG